MSIFLFRQPRCVFIRVRKTGTTSFYRGMFGGRPGAELISTDGRWLPEFDGLFAFGFVRNPFERMASALRMFREYKVVDVDEAALRDRLDLDLLMDMVEDDDLPLDRGDYRSKLRLHALPMTHPYYHLDRAHFVGRFETFDRDYRHVAERLGVAVATVPHVHTRGPIDYRDHFGVSERRRAETLLRQDCERFGYAF